MFDRNAVGHYADIRIFSVGANFQGKLTDKIEL